MLDYGIFYEFIPMSNYGTKNQKIIPLSDVEIGINYAIIITTNAGLWRYKIGDTIKFTSLNPYKIKVTGRTKHYINAFGEELVIENSDTALLNACTKTNSEIIEYTAAPIYMDGNKKGSHEWLIEFKKAPEHIGLFVKLLDDELKSLNSDYEAKRLNDITLTLPTLKIARPQLFHDWLKINNKLGGQHKIPRLSNSRGLVEELNKLNTASIIL